MYLGNQSLKCLMCEVYQEIHDKELSLEEVVINMIIWTQITSLIIST
jgi:hypothetical protein